MPEFKIRCMAVGCKNTSVSTPTKEAAERLAKGLGYKEQPGGKYFCPSCNAKVTSSAAFGDTPGNHPQ